MILKKCEATRTLAKAEELGFSGFAPNCDVCENPAMIPMGWTGHDIIWWACEEHAILCIKHIDSHSEDFRKNTEDALEFYYEYQDRLHQRMRYEIEKELLFHV